MYNYNMYNYKHVFIYFNILIVVQLESLNYAKNDSWKIIYTLESEEDKENNEQIKDESDNKNKNRFHYIII